MAHNQGGVMNFGRHNDLSEKEKREATDRRLQRLRQKKQKEEKEELELSSQRGDLIKILQVKYDGVSEDQWEESQQPDPVPGNGRKNGGKKGKRPRREPKKQSKPYLSWDGPERYYLRCLGCGKNGNFPQVGDWTYRCVCGTEIAVERG